MAEGEEVEIEDEGGESLTMLKHEDEKAAEEARQQDLLRKREERRRKMEEDEKRDEEERKKREDDRQKRKSERDKRLKEKEASMKKEIEEMEKKAKKEEDRRKKREDREARWLAEEAAAKEAEERRRKEREERKLQELELEEEERRRKRMEEEAKNQRDEEPVTWITEEDEEEKALREERKKRRQIVDTIIRYVNSQSKKENGTAVDSNEKQSQEESEAAWVIERIVMDEAIREEVNSLISEDYKPITDLLVRPPSLFTLIKAVTCSKDGSRLHVHRSELMYSRSPFNPKPQNETASQKNSMLSNSDLIFPPTIPPPIQPVLDPLARSVARVEFALNILTEGVLPVARIVSSSDNHYLLDTLFQMLKDNQPPTPSPNLHLFSKVLSSFMNRRPSEMSDYLTKKANYLIELLVSHFGCPEISELIWKMLESEIMLKSDGLNVPDDELEPNQTQPTLSRRNSVTILTKITEPTPLNNSCPSWSDALLPFLATRLQRHERTWKELEDHGGDPVKLEKFESWLKLCGEEIENMGQLFTDILSKYPKSRLARSVLGHTFSSALIHLTFTINPPLPAISSPLLSLIDLLLTQIHKKQHIQIVAQAQELASSSTPSSPSSRPPPSKAPNLVISLISPMGERSMNYTPLHILARWMDSIPTTPSTFAESQISLQPRPSTPAQSRIVSNDIKKSPLSSASPNDIKLASSKSASSSPSKSRPVVVVSSSSPNGKTNHTTSQQSQSQQQQQPQQTPTTTSPHPIVGMGILRLRALQCVRSLTRLEWEGVNIEGRLVNSGALKSTIKMFFNYPSNNMMHSIVSSMIKDLIVRCGEKYDHSPSNSAHNGNNSNHNEKVNLTGRNSGAVAKISTGNPSPAVSRLLEHILKECGLISGILKVLKGSPGSGTPSIFPSLDIDNEKVSLAPIPKPIPIPPAENMPYVTSICRDLTHMAVKKKWLQMIIQDCSGEDQWLDLIVVRLGLGTSQEELRWKSSPKPTLNRAPSRYKFVVPTPKVDV